MERPWQSIIFLILSWHLTSNNLHSQINTIIALTTYCATLALGRNKNLLGSRLEISINCSLPLSRRYLEVPLLTHKRFSSLLSPPFSPPISAANNKQPQNSRETFTSGYYPPRQNPSSPGCHHRRQRARDKKRWGSIGKFADFDCVAVSERAKN
jgi:hypothetical protein